LVWGERRRERGRATWNKKVNRSGANPKTIRQATKKARTEKKKGETSKMSTRGKNVRVRGRHQWIQARLPPAGDEKKNSIKDHDKKYPFYNATWRGPNGKKKNPKSVHEEENSDPERKKKKGSGSTCLWKKKRVERKSHRLLSSSAG